MTPNNQMIKADVHMLICCMEILTMVVSVMDPKLLMKMLQVTLTGGPDRSRCHHTLYNHTGFLNTTDDVF